MKKEKNSGLQSSEPRDVVAPLYEVISKDNYNLYQKRIEVYLYGEAQAALAGQRNISGNKIPSDGMHPIIEIPMKTIIQDNDAKSFGVIKKAAKSMVGRAKERRLPDGSIYVYSPIIAVKIPPYSGMLSVEVHRDTWNYLLDFRGGTRRFDANVAISMRSVHSIKMYQFVSEQKNTVPFGVDTLKNFFGVKDRYKQTGDFVRRVLQPVKEELDSVSPYTFSYEILKDGRKIVGFKITPLQNGYMGTLNERRQLERRRLYLSDYVPDSKCRDYLKVSIGFTEDELMPHGKLLAVAYAIFPDFLDILANAKGKSYGKKNPKGWIIKALRGKVSDFFKERNIVNPLDNPKNPLAVQRQLEFNDAVNDIATLKKLK